MDIMPFINADNFICLVRLVDLIPMSFTLQGKQGIVKLIYRGVIFLYDENEEENGGYFCCKARLCVKIKNSAGLSKEKVCLKFELVFSLVTDLYEK